MKITFLGHATCLIEIDGFRLLTDPNFSRRIALGVRRESPLAFDPADLPPLDAVCLTHLHYDHCDIPSFKYISCKTPIVMPTGLRAFMAPILPHPLIELEIWSSHRFKNPLKNSGTREGGVDGREPRSASSLADEEGMGPIDDRTPTGGVFQRIHRFKDGLEVVRVPVRHRGGRISHLRRTAVAGFLIRGRSETLFFAGDTGMTDHFSEIGSLGAIDVALLPIGPTEPRWFMARRHLSPAQALEARRQLGAGRMIPIHWGAFRLGLDDVRAPLETLKMIIPPAERERICILEPGETYTMTP